MILSTIAEHAVRAVRFVREIAFETFGTPRCSECGRYSSDYTFPPLLCDKRTGEIICVWCNERASR